MPKPPKEVANKENEADLEKKDLYTDNEHVVLYEKKFREFMVM